MGNQRRNCTFINQFCLKNNWTHMVLPHLFFYSELHCSLAMLGLRPPVLTPNMSYSCCSLPQVIAHRHPPRTIQCLLQEELYPSSWHKAQPDRGPRAGSNTEPSAAPGKLLWVTWPVNRSLNKNSAVPAPASPSPVKVSNAVHSRLAAKRWCP